MSRSIRRELLAGAALSLCALFGCDSLLIVHGHSSHPAPAVVHSPPAWAPAHGYRAKCRYHYYPSAAVYFDIDRRVYFYQRAGVWQTSVTLPAGFTIEMGECVVLELDTARPYEFHHETARHHPPGQTNRIATRKLR